VAGIFEEEGVSRRLGAMQVRSNLGVPQKRLPAMMKFLPTSCGLPSYIKTHLIIIKGLKKFRGDLLGDIFPFIRAYYATLADPGRRTFAGLSMGPGSHGSSAANGTASSSLASGRTLT